jgi:hypothetical protein
MASPNPDPSGSLEQAGSDSRTEFNLKAYDCEEDKIFFLTSKTYRNYYSTITSPKKTDLLTFETNLEFLGLKLKIKKKQGLYPTMHPSPRPLTIQMQIKKI